MDILIITRFSLSLNMKTDNLHNIERLDKRLFIFENLTLPSVINQSNKNFKWIILYDKLLPSSILEKLQQITKPFSIIHLHEFQTNEDKLDNLTIFNKFLDENNTHTLTIRLDDDDAISHNLIRDHFTLATKNLQKFLIITNPNGLYWKVGESFMKKTHKFIALGLSLLVEKKINPITIYFHDHSQIDRNIGKISTKYDVKKAAVYNMDRYSYIRTLHRETDSKTFQKMQFINNYNNLTFISQNYSLKPDVFKIIAKKYLK